ncbi:hypothetical protein HPB49_019939 [Dermacentor silvarum]|uniref:Uncharacterized protein n=1 Tax=Dermacentor silvarum TaxID=543639 RepID=A0ACB8D790_DERSI|nr:slit homolog 1 protein [Dermacentor silvarum]KAH7960447.1 hypothetical protein HPB49_019939 [Dermacentor silvarum]
MFRMYWLFLLLQCCSVRLALSEPTCQKFQTDTDTIFFNCAGFTSASQLATKIPRPEPEKHSFSLSDSRLERLPVDAFDGLSASNVTLNNVHVDDFEASHPNAFERLNGTLVELVFVRGSTLPKSWSLLQDVLSLTSLRFEKQAVSIDHDWSNLPRSLRDIFITESTVTSLEQGALNVLTSIERFGITDSRLRNFSWSVLPSPAFSLHTILLSENELTEIPKRFIAQQFPALRSIHLESNAITTWDEETLDAIRQHPNSPRLILGAIACDCRVRKLLEFPRNQISATCASPDEWRHRRIGEIRVEDLRC